MTDRAQPGAIKSVTRNDELAQVLGQLTGGFESGWVVPAGEPTAVARRRPEIDETALDAFAITTAADSLDVTVAGGEAFAAGWCAIDEPTTLTLDASATTEIVVTWSPDAIYDPESDPDRDAADEVTIAPESVVDETHPRASLWGVETDGSGVIDVNDRRHRGPATAPKTYPTLDDVPPQEARPTGAVYYVEAEQQLFVENGDPE